MRLPFTFIVNCYTYDSMFFYLHNGFGIYIKFEMKKGSLVCLTSGNDHVFIFSGCKHIGLFFAPVRHFAETFL